MKSSKLVCRAAIFGQTVSFMHKLLVEMRQPTMSACPLLTVDALREIKGDQTENSCLLFLNVLCVIEFVYANTIILFNFGE